MSELALPGAVDTQRLGTQLASTLQWSKSAPLVVYLQGELGSGKTTLARGLLHALGVVGTVRSPTYTLLEYYESHGHRLVHLDLYRLGGATDLAPLGLRDELLPGVLVLIEWPERAERLLPPPDLRIDLTIAPEGHRARLEGLSGAGVDWLGRLPFHDFPELKRV